MAIRGLPVRTIKAARHGANDHLLVIDENVMVVSSTNELMHVNQMDLVGFPRISTQFRIINNWSVEHQSDLNSQVPFYEREARTVQYVKIVFYSRNAASVRGRR